MPQGYHEEHMPYFDSNGREIIKIVSENECGWRYGYRDELTKESGYKEYKGAKGEPREPKVEEKAKEAQVELAKPTEEENKGWT